MPVNDATQETLRRAEKKLCELAKELKKNWDLRQNKTKLQKSTQEAFAIIHDSSLEENLTSMIELLKKVISALPPSQSELFDVQDCYPGFMEWNKFWKKSYSEEKRADQLSLGALTNVHIYYEQWVKTSKSENCSKFQELWELVMIRSCSEAICEPVGSIMNQHAGKNRHLEPRYFSMEIYLRFNLGPLHLMKDLIKEVLSDKNSKSYTRKGEDASQFTTKDINKNSTIANYEENCEKKSRFPNSFWNFSSQKPK